MQNLSKKGLLLASFLLFSCHDSKKFSFSSPEEAIGCCRDFLGDIKEKDMSDIRTLAEVSNKWIELRDSSIVCMERASSFILNEDIVTSYIGLTDSIKTEITNAAVSKNRTIEELLKIMSGDPGAWSLDELLKENVLNKDIGGFKNEKEI